MFALPDVMLPRRVTIRPAWRIALCLSPAA
jgi:hypothetical protein